jgi:hypothetical protein
VRVRLVALASLAAASAVLAAAARAGGTQVEIVVAGGHVWVTAGSDVAELDAATGRVLERRRTRYPYAMELGAGGGAVWASSVENGFISGAVDRIPLDGSRPTHPLVLPDRPVYALAVGARTTWALVGPWRALRLAAIDRAGGRVRLSRLADVGWIAADPTGRVPGLYAVTQRHGILRRLGADGWSASGPRVETKPTVGAGAVWAATAHSLERVDPRTGRVAAGVGLAGLPVEVATGGGFVWTLTLERSPAGRYLLTKVDPARMRVVARRTVGRRVGGLAYGDGALWLGRLAPVGVLRVNPRTLTTRLLAAGLG